jgi:hypothetical protein
MPSFTDRALLSRAGFRAKLEGQRIDVAEAQQALATALPGAPSLPSLQRLVADAGRAQSADGYVTAGEADTLFQRLKGFDPYTSASDTLTVSRPAAPQLAMYRILQSLAQATEAAPNPVGAQATRVVASLPANLRARATTAVPEILTQARARNLSLDQTAYVLATARHESLMGNAMLEFASGSAYEGRLDLGNTRPGDGVRYKGRGFVQITGRGNYRDWSNRLGVDLLAAPQLAERPEIAARILVDGMRLGTFTGYRLDDFISGGNADFVGARRIVNGLDRAGDIAAYARTYRSLLA